MERVLVDSLSAWLDGSSNSGGFIDIPHMCDTCSNLSHNGASFCAV
jgi:hypothetical protein